MFKLPNDAHFGGELFFGGFSSQDMRRKSFNGDGALHQWIVTAIDGGGAAAPNFFFETIAIGEQATERESHDGCILR